MSKSAAQVAERSTIAEISASLSTDAIVELFEIDMGSVSSFNKKDILRFHAGTNDIDKEIVWQGNVYTPFPIQIDGFELDGTKQIPRPSMKVANITTTITGDGWGTIGNLTRDFEDLAGVKVSRKRTYAKYLDNFCILTGDTTSGYCSDDSYNSSIVDCCIQGGGAWDTDTLSCSGSSLTWTSYDCTTCAAAGGTWYVNHNSEWKAISNPQVSLLVNDAHRHSHSISLSSSDLCILGDGTQVTKTTETNEFITTEIEVTSTGVGGSIDSFYPTNNGKGYDNEAVCYIKAISMPLISTGSGTAYPGDVPHTHDVDLTSEQIASLVQGTIPSITTSTTFEEGHTHSIEVTWTGTRLNVAILGAPHSSPHTLIYNTTTDPIFSSVELTEDGALSTFTIVSGGTGWNTTDVLLLLPTPTVHTHDVVLEYLYEGTDTKELVNSDNEVWYPSSGTTITSDYDSGDIGHTSCLRIESNAINDYAFIDLNTFKDKEYTISFDYKIVHGNTQKLVIESDDGSWHSEHEEAITGTGWSNYSATIFMDDITRAERTRFKIYASDSTGGPDDEVLIDNFQVEQTWVRGDLIARSISNNSTDNHTLSQYNNLIINTSDPESYFQDDIYFIDKKTSENKLLVEFELAPAWDVEGIKLPKREIIQNTCLWVYRGTDGCSYSDSRYFDKNDEPTSDSSQDFCGKRLTSCELRFATPESSYTTSATCQSGGYYWNSSLNSCWNLEKAILPYGGFPGVGLGANRV